jgi:hypothetical protein
MLISSRSPQKIHSRQITDSDIGDVAGLLSRGFHQRSHTYWLRALRRLSEHPTPAGFPRFGYLLESAGAPVGAILLITSSISEGNIPTIRCNVSSWYVEPTYRSHAALLLSQALKYKNVTYVNVSAAARVLPIIEAFGFSRYSNGQFVAIVPLWPEFAKARVRSVTADASRDERLASFEWRLLQAHAGYGCISLLCITADCAHPFVFLPRLVKGFIRCAQLIYCRDLQDFVDLRRAIGWFLALRGFPLIIIDANGPIRGLVGRYFDGVVPKYFKGPVRPRLGDLSYTEAAIFGS